jgi:hypothetical protein
MKLLTPNRTANRSSRVAVSLIALLACLGFAHTASAQPAQSESEWVQGNASQPFKGFYLKSSPGWSLGLEAYAGLAVLTGGDATRGHGMAGGLSRLRTGYFEAGAGFEMSDLAIERWRQMGGFVGTYLPILHWVDIDATVGLAQRNYLNPDKRYGPGGLDVKGAALTFRLGFSDRPISDEFGLRLGAALLVDVDLKHHEVPWTYDLGAQGVVSATSHFGGVSAGIAVCLGFDVAFGRSARR